MSSYRFCRTDDIGLLVGALNRCWHPYFPDEPAMTPEAFKRSIRDLQVWCSSCMVAFAGGDPIGVLIGAKRRSGTLIHRIAVHPDHRRQGHGGHLLESLGAKLSILGPPRMVAEVPDTSGEAAALFTARGYVQETLLTDYVLQSLPEAGSLGSPMASQDGAGVVVPITIDDLDANGLLDGCARHTCWERSVESLAARKDEISGLAVASDERIEAWLLYRRETEIVSLWTFIDDGGARLGRLLHRLGPRPLRFPKVHPDEVPEALLTLLGFRPAGQHRLLGATARPQ